MSKQTTTDLRFPGSADGDIVPVPKLSSSFTVAYTAASGASSDVVGTEVGLSQPEVLLRITATTDCFITTAVTPTAVADGSHHYLPAGIPQDVRVPGIYKIAAIRSAVDGSIYCTALV